MVGLITGFLLFSLMVYSEQLYEDKPDFVKLAEKIMTSFLGYEFGSHYVPVFILMIINGV